MQSTSSYRKNTSKVHRHAAGHAADRGKGDDHMMPFQENSRIDLEDLLYDGQEPAVSER